jgi:lysophospholipase L1-like esterase
MKKTLLIISALLLVSSWPAWQLHAALSKLDSEDPLVWEEDVQALEAADAGGNNPDNAVVFIGSSSIRLWDNLDTDMAPVTVIRRGFGGSKLNDVVYYAQRLVNVHQPVAVVVFAGSNDLRPGDTKPAEVLLESYKQFIAKVRVSQKDLPIYFIAITPTISRWAVWPEVQQTNQLIAEYSAQDDNLHVIDTGQALLGDDGKPNPENYRLDRLHLSEQGYAIWTRLIRPHVLQYGRER